MTFWLDAQLPPALAGWLRERFGVDACALRDIGLRDASDAVIFASARKEGAVIISKDIDFVDLVQRLGTPPQMLWITCGNVTNARLKIVFEATLPAAMALLAEGRPVVEIADAT